MERGPFKASDEKRPAEGSERITLAFRLQQIEQAGSQHFQSFLVRRLANLRQVRRLALTWLAVALVLIGIGWWQVHAQRDLYSHAASAEGGVYIEGTVGTINTLNPIFATNVAEKSLSSLLFSGLLRIDGQGDIAGDLAESWTISDDGRVYTLTLRPDAVWSDGTPITSEDVLFTVDAIQSAAADSPLAVAWEGVQAEAEDEQTVSFTLKAPYAPFSYILTAGILPKHVLASVAPDQLRSAAFSSQPGVTSGPFSYRGTVKGSGDGAARTDVYLVRNGNYHLGAPKLKRFTLRVYEDREGLSEAMQVREIMAANGVAENSVDVFAEQDELRVTELKLFNGVFAFFNMSAPPLDNRDVRRALALGTDVGAVAEQVGRAEPIHGPLLQGQLGYNADVVQQTNNLQLANKLLNKAGWKRGEDGMRQKKGRQLELRLVTQSSGEFDTVVQKLQQQWERLGVSIEARVVEPGEFQQNVLTPHDYDILVYQLALGRDSDSYAFWHSSQAQPGRLNLSEYTSDRADQALESGRTATDSRLRSIKYKNFAEQWIKDVPAVALYQPNLYYVQLEDSRSVEEGDLGDLEERFANIRYWTAETTRLYNTR